MPTCEPTGDSQPNDGSVEVKTDPQRHLAGHFYSVTRSPGADITCRDW